MVLAEIGNRQIVATDAPRSIEAAWVPDIQMPVPFAPHHVLMASLYMRGYGVPEIAGIIGRRPNYCVKLLNDVYAPLSMPHKIREATGYVPKSTVQTVLWMSKHKFLEPIPAIPLDLKNVKNPFNQSHLNIMHEYMAGNTTHRGIAEKIFLSEATIRNYFSTYKQSIRTVISRSSPDGWFPPTMLSAGYWMVTHGYLPAGIIGEQLP